MSNLKEYEAPYYFCGRCKILRPIKVIGGARICLKCGREIGMKEGGKVILLSRKEAVMRGLLTVKDSQSGELYED